ncbi:hypothetical protein GLYMA_10G187650v4 [Glycine max]|nr:hypothetical protein GLYMA_10G187650v4 [Glycine max]KAH1138974.1 hypothetical protein GYH30_028430 [Glycine max]
MFGALLMSIINCGLICWTAHIFTGTPSFFDKEYHIQLLLYLEINSQSFIHSPRGF